MKVPYIVQCANKIPQIAGLRSLQTHFTEKSILVTSGCSFTSTGRAETHAVTWPRLLRERCGMPRSVEYGWPGSGNEYIADTILHHISKINDQEAEKTLVVVMWSGINRFDKKNIQTTKNNPHLDPHPFLNEVFYTRAHKQEEISDGEKYTGAQESADRIFQVAKALTDRNILFAFSFYCNLLYPPYIPKPDLTHEFDNYVDATTLIDLKNLPIIPRKPMDFMFEYAFCNDLLADDGFHPSYDGNLQWTDNILLPGLVDLDVVYKV